MSEMEQCSVESENRERGWMDRRSFLVLTGSALGALGLDQLNRKRRFLVAAETVNSVGLSHGVIEGGIESPFFTLEEGHGDWLKEAVQHPVVNEVCHSVIEKMDSLPEGFSSIGEAFACVCEESILSLVKEYPTAPKKLLFSEAIHVAVIAAAGVFSHFIDYADFGFDTTKWGGSAVMFDQRWGENGIGKKFPPLFPAADSQAKFEIEGRDRSMHFFNHLLLAYELWYSKETDGTAHLTTPPVMNLVSDHLLSLDPSRATAIFSWIAGMGYEAMTTFSDRESAGFGDLEVRYDLVANQFGAILGFRLAQGDLARIMKVMYDSRLIQESDDPQQVVEYVLNDYDI